MEHFSDKIKILYLNKEFPDKINVLIDVSTLPKDISLEHYMRSRNFVYDYMMALYKNSQSKLKSIKAIKA